MITNIKLKLLVYGLVSLTMGVIAGYLALWRFSASMTSPIPEQVLSAQEPEPLPESVADLDKLNMLLLGQGGAGHEGGELTDAIMLVEMDFEQARIGLISIPRDVWIETQKINNLYATDYGKLKDAVTTITGESVNYFVAVDFVGFQRAMGYVLDGVGVDVGQDFDDPWYPTEGKQLDPCGYTPEEIADLTARYSDFELQKHFACRYERVQFDQGVVFMNGAEALKYVRSRHSSSDFDRGRRQQEVLMGVGNKLWSLKAFDQIEKFLGEFTKYVQTDVDLEIAKYLAPAIKGAKDFKIIRVNLSTENVLKEAKVAGAFALVPKDSFEAIRSYVKQQLEATN